MIVLLRHAETEANVEKRYIGQTETNITARGVEQSKQLADLLQRRFTWDFVFCSPQLRTQQTAHHLGIRQEQLTIDERLSELHFGEWEGKTYKELVEQGEEKRLYNWYENPHTTAPPQGESVTDLGKRIDHFFQSIDNEKNILLITHAGVMQYVLWQYVYKGKREFWKVPRIDHSMWIEISWKDGTAYYD
ncbi:MAG: histidine phosphatase family protein [Bacilli bacterium]